MGESLDHQPPLIYPPGVQGSATVPPQSVAGRQGDKSIPVDPPALVVWRRPPVRRTFTPRIYGSAGRESRGAAPEEGVSGEERDPDDATPSPEYAGRHSDAREPEQSGDGSAFYNGTHRLEHRRPDYVSRSIWAELLDGERRSRVPAWWLVPPTEMAWKPVIPYGPVSPPDTPLPIHDAVMQSFAEPPPPPPPPEQTLEPASEKPPPPKPVPPPIPPAQPSPKPAQGNIRPPTPSAQGPVPAGAVASDPNVRADGMGSPPTTEQRVGRLAWLSAAGLATRKWFKDPEKGKRRRVLAVAAGALALAATAVGIYFAVRHGGHYAGAEYHPPVSPSGTAVPTPHQTLPPATTLALQHGDNPWHDIEAYALQQGVNLHGHPQEHRIVGEIITDNHITWSQAHHLPVGWRLVITPQRAQEIANLR